MNEKPTVKLVGEDGNAFMIMGRVSKALKRAGQEDKAKEFTEKAFISTFGSWGSNAYFL